MNEPQIVATAASIRYEAEVTSRLEKRHDAKTRARRLLAGSALGLLLSMTCFLGGLSLAAESAEVETAALSPGGLRPFDDVALPQPLKDSDAARYRRIFRLQEKARWLEADREIAKLGDKILLGQVLVQRYLDSDNYRAKFAELSKWLASYADHPDAPHVYKLALKRMPKGGIRPRQPPDTIFGASTNGDSFETDHEGRPLNPAERRRLAQLRREIRARLGDGSYGAADQLLKSVEAQRLLGPAEYDQLSAEIADGLYTLNQDREAIAVADTARARGAGRPSLAEREAGLVAWRLGQYDNAAQHFERLAMIDAIDSWTRAAAAYWAARSNLRANAPEKAIHWLAIGSNYPYTFYGILARKLFGKPFDYNWDVPAFTRADAAQIEATRAGQRALALIQVGETGRAERELRRLAPNQPETAHALLAISQRADMPSLGVQMADLVTDKSGWRYDAALYPLPGWEPPGGYKIDRAFIFALIRQESNFSSVATSPAGARGLMQLMPSTARFVSGGTQFRGNRNQLFNPAINIALGQNYLAHLMGTDYIGDNLFWVVAAYNGGPGNLARWQREFDPGDDPLIFLESIPNLETRQFVEHVLANYWIYRDELGQPTPELDAIAEGRWPTYKSSDGNSNPAAAQNGGD